MNNPQTNVNGQSVARLKGQLVLVQMLTWWW